ncbi:nucleoside deaminase [Streptomyces thinghirensis]|nr:nucleoside deaminase [Streptomyces thinghirensis]
MNLVDETGCDPTAHAEIVALRKAVRARGQRCSAGSHPAGDGRPCALCYRVAAAHGIAAVRFAVDRDTAAAWGFDYRAGYAVDATDRLPLAATARPLPVERGLAPFVRYLDLHRDDFTTHSSPTTT